MPVVDPTKIFDRLHELAAEAHGLVSKLPEIPERVFLEAHYGGEARAEHERYGEALRRRLKP